MARMLTLAFALLCSVAWLQAQETSQQASPSAAGQTGAKSGQTSVKGCLQGSNGNFTITDSAGTSYQLQGDASTLAKHVGHEVEVTGSTSGSGSASAASGGTSAGSQQTLSVDKVKHISDSCKSMSK